MLILWLSLVCLCIYYTLTHPTKQGVLVCGVFVLATLLPEITKGLSFLLEYEIRDGYGYVINAISVTIGVTLLSLLSPSRLRCTVMTLLGVELVINVLGIIQWYHNLGIHASNLIYDTTGYAPAILLGEMWIYSCMIITYYLIAAYYLYDRKGRAKNVGNGISQFIGDYVLSYYLSFKGVVK